MGDRGDKEKKQDPVVVLEVNVEWYFRSPGTLTGPLWASGATITNLFMICTALLDLLGGAAEWRAHHPTSPGSH